MRKAVECSGFLDCRCHRINSDLLRFSLQRLDVEWRCDTQIRLSKHAHPVTGFGDRRICSERLGSGKLCERAFSRTDETIGLRLQPEALCAAGGRSPDRSICRSY